MLTSKLNFNVCIAATCLSMKNVIRSFLAFTSRGNYGRGSKGARARGAGRHLVFFGWVKTVKATSLPLLYGTNETTVTARFFQISRQSSSKTLRGWFVTSSNGYL